MKFCYLFPIACLFYIHALAADESVLEELITTGSYLANTDSVKRLPNIVIDSASIAALAPVSFADVLKGQPGIDIIEQGGVGGLTFLSLRGGDPNFVTILVDGVKVNDPTNSRGGAFDLGTLDPAIIDKVEIYYGGVSMVHGSNGLAGLISIHTKGYQDDSLGQVSVKAGSNDMRAVTTYLGLALGDVSELSIAASIQDGDNSSFGDAFERKELIASLTSRGQRNTHWRVSGFYADAHAEMFPEDSGGDRLAVVREPESRDYTQNNVAATLQHKINSDFYLSLDGAWSQREEDISNPGIAEGVLDQVPAIDSDTRYERLDLNARANYRVSQMVNTVVGVAMGDEDGGMVSVIDFGFPVPADYTLKRKTESVFAELGLDPLPGLQITAGIRHDNTDELAVTTNRLISRYQLSEKTSFSAQYSEGFKLPSFFALAHPFVGNADLKPERSKNYDLSIERSGLNDRLSARFSMYQNIFTDLVDFDPELFTNVNRSKIQAQGVELYLGLQATDSLDVSGQVRCFWPS